MNILDCVVIGAGPAGMSAALYASRGNLKTLMVEKECPGGKMLKTKVIENYLAGSIDSFKLASDMFAHSIKFGAKYKQAKVLKIDSVENYKKITLDTGEELYSYSIILAIGGKLSENSFKYDKYRNKGLSYCVICDANFYKDKEVAIIGDNRSIEDVDYLANIAKKVYFINKEEDCSNRSNVENLINIKDYDIQGESIVENIIINDKKIPIDGVFYVSDSNSFSGIVENLKINNGYIAVDNYMHTSEEGIFACGDIIDRNIKQVVTACGDGAIAGIEAIKYVNKCKNQVS